jgi:O-antigen/teichoic acid export membrane protein
MASQTRKITLDTAALFFGRAVGLLLGIVRLNFLATYLGVANFGILNFAAYFASLFQSLFDLGLSQLLTRELSRDLSRSKDLLGTVAVLKVVMVFLASLVVGIAVVLSHFDRVTNRAILLTTVAVAINGIAMAFLSAFQAHRKMVLVSITNIVNDVILSAAIILLIPRFPAVNTALILAGIVSLANLVILLRVYTRTVGVPQFRVDVPAWRLLLKEGTPMAVSAFGISTYTFIGPTVLKYTRGEVEVGIYSAAYKLISILTLIPVAFTQVVYPIFSDFSANARHKLGKALQDSLRVMVEISVPLAVGTLILAPNIISLLYPESFFGSVPVLRLLIAGTALGYLAWILVSFLLAVEHQDYCMWNSLAVAALVLVANLIIAPRFGYLGVASIAATTDVALFLSLYTYTARIGFPVHDFTILLKVVAAAGVMGLVVYLLRDGYLVLVILSGICIYGILLYALRVLGEQERELLAKLISRV